MASEEPSDEEFAKMQADLQQGFVRCLVCGHQRDAGEQYCPAC